MKMSPEPPKACPSTWHTVAAGSCSRAGNTERSHERGGLRPCSRPLSPLVTSASSVQLWPVSPMALLVSGLQWIAKLQSCGFLQLAGKFDAGFPYVRSLQGSTAQHGSSLQQPHQWQGAECCARALALSTPPWALPSHHFPQPKAALFLILQPCFEIRD